MSYLCLLLVFALLGYCICDNLCIDSERQALLEFKHGLVDEAGRLASWTGEESDCCEWVGIGCDNVTGHVHQLDLRALEGHCDVSKSVYDRNKDFDEARKQMLKGNFSSSLMQLKQLKYLDASCNDFGWIQVPTFIASLGNLEYLNLSRSNFSGIIPPQLGNLSELHVLSLGSFRSIRYESTTMVDMQWLPNLHKLHHLDLSAVNLSQASDWLQVINSLPSLKELHLSRNGLRDMHPYVFSSNLTSLSLLDLSHNYFSQGFMPQWIYSIKSLVSLDLTSCIFQGTIPNSIYSFRNLTNLESLHVHDNTFMNSSSVLQGLSSSKIISLDISTCDISSSVLDALHNLTSLHILDLSQNYLTEPLPKSLGNLCNLREIDLAQNQFDNISLTNHLEYFFKCGSPSLESLFLASTGVSGHLPDQIGKLIHLVHLMLFENNIVGTIPASIGRLVNLQVLVLTYNALNGSLPFSIGRLSSLQVLQISHNRLNGNLPSSLGQLSKLKELGFSYNLMTGVVTEAHFDKLLILNHLDGAGNNLVLRPKHANWIPPFQLESLFLNSWVLGPQFPLWLQSQRELLYLDVSNTSISSPIHESFWRFFPDLVYLDMSKNLIQGTFSSIPLRLWVLDLNSNKFTGRLPSNPGPSLDYMDVSNNSFEGSLHQFLCSYDRSWTGVLNMGNNHLSGVIPECWENWAELRFLNLENNNLSGVIPVTLGSLAQLEALNMHGNKLSGRLPAFLMNLTNLVILQLGRNELVGSIPELLGSHLSSLRVLNLRFNNFNGKIPHEICNLTHIQILDLAHNKLSGNIPRCISKFDVLSGKETISNVEFSYPYSYYAGSSEYSGSSVSALATDSLVLKGREDTYDTILGLVTLLDLSSNYLIGHIPSEHTMLSALQSLNLSRNQLTGRIPDKIGDMKALVSLDVSMNKLYGELPMSLSNLHFLSSFNVSYNNLTGTIPLSTQLQSFNESSFVGNGLCGAPLTDSCIPVEVPDSDVHIQEEEEEDGPNWGLIISIMVGFVSGFWIFLVPLIVRRSWRIKYFHFMSELGYMGFDFIRKYCFNKFFRK